jgi:hypothetical protein
LNKQPLNPVIPTSLKEGLEFWNNLVNPIRVVKKPAGFAKIIFHVHDDQNTPFRV